MQMSPKSIAERFSVSRESFDRLNTYAGLLGKWQSRINLIAASTTGQIWPRHIADGLQIIEMLPRGARTIVDIGSGSGIPGIVIAIMCREQPGARVHMVESNNKKAAFLREAVRVTAAAGTVHHSRIEDLGAKDIQSPVDVVTARAVAPLVQLLDLAHPFVKNGALGLFHKGQDVDIELTAATKYWKLDYGLRPSKIDSRGCILEIKEMERVACV